MFYNNTTGEITYDLASNVVAGNANYANFAGQVVDATQSNITLLGTLTDLYMSNANVHLGTNAAANSQGTSIIAIGNNAASGGTAVTHTYVSYDPATFILTLDDTTGIVSGMTISGTGFTNNQFVYQVIDSTTLEMSDLPDSTPSGTLSFNSGQQTDAIAIGHNAGNVSQLANSISIGSNAGSFSQQYESIAIGSNAASNVQGFQSIAIGLSAGSNNQGPQSVAIGYLAGSNTQNPQSFAMGYLAGSNNQGASSVAIGANSGVTTQGSQSVAIGQGAGRTTQGSTSIAIGSIAGQNAQSGGAIAIGGGAGNSTQGANAVAIGRRAGSSNQGASSIAIGVNAGFTNQAVNSIILNATGANLNQTTANTFTVKPVRQANTANIMYYNNTTGEISYDVSTGITANSANFANFAGNVTVNAQPNITSLGNLVSLTINNGNVELPTKQFNPTGVDIGSNANILLMANSSFVDVDYGNGQGGGNLRFGKTTSYVKARGNSSAIASAAANDVAGRTNYMFYNGTSNVLAVSTQVNLTTLNSNANAITSGGNYQIITANPNGDQGNANALSNQNLYVFENSGRLSITTGAATGSGSALAITGYGITAGGNGVQSQGMAFVRYRGNRDSNLSVQANDQLGSFGFIGYNGSALYTARSASLQGIVDSAYVTNASVITSGFKLTSVGASSQNDNWFYSNANVKFGLSGGGNSVFQTDATVFVNNFDSAGNVANIAGNLNVVQNANITGNITGGNVIVNTSGFAKLSSYTVSALNAITGSIGWMAAVSDSASGGNPNGMLAFWDTTNSRWSYVHDNSAV
jgi:hypothetical protein